jgi:hypothetical protein
VRVCALRAVLPKGKFGAKNISVHRLCEKALAIQAFIASTSLPGWMLAARRHMCVHLHFVREFREVRFSSLQVITSRLETGAMYRFLLLLLKKRYMSSPPTIDATAAQAVTDWHDDPSLSEKWKFRFGFFEQYGVPGFWTSQPEHKAAIKALPIGDMLKISMNWYAFLFSFIYYGFFLKLWRQALIIVGIIVIANAVVVIFDLNHSIARGIGIGLQCGFGMRANVLYYLKRTKGDIGWQF